MNITQEITYNLNYKPLLNFKKELKSFNTIYCKNFFIFFLLIESIINLRGKKHNMRVSIRKKNKHNQTFLRAPNKYKKAQISIELVRYEVKFKVNFYYNLDFLLIINQNTKSSNSGAAISSLNYLTYFINFFFFFFFFFESTLFFLKKKEYYIELESRLVNKLILEIL